MVFLRTRTVALFAIVTVATVVAPTAGTASPAAAAAVRTAAANCFVPEATMSNLGGGFPGVKQIQGYGYVVCDHIDPALGITGVIYSDGMNGTVDAGGYTIPVGAGGDSTGANACPNAYLCLMKTQRADGYGVRVCYTLTNVGTATNPAYTGTKSRYDCF